ncbi:MAG: hypothetical protein ABFS46_11540 [Myxococcota bacterium]
MDVPGIKGSAFEAVVTDLVAAIEAGRISREAVEARLEPEDLAVLDSKIVASSWYPIEIYQRLSEILVEVEGGGKPEYVLARGARAAERLFTAGLYQQLRFGEERGRAIQDGGELWSQRDGAIMATLAGAIFNFSKWRFEVVDAAKGTHRIEVTGAAPMPEVARLAAQGFIEYTSSRLSGTPLRVESHRPEPDRIVFSIGRAR